jgi:hypothetical protein
MLRKFLTEYLCHVPLGTWPEFCAQTRSGRRELLSSRDAGELLKLFGRTNLWYLRYVFHFLTFPLRRKPTIFLMGFPKCGTTYFADLLSLHEDIGSPTGLAPIGKETMHYRKDQIAHALMPIRGFYPIFSRAENLFDASVSYSYDPGAMSWIKRDYPDGKVILIVRNQVGTFESMMNYYNVRLWRKASEDLQIFNDPDAYRRVSMKKVEQAIEFTRKSQRSSSVTIRSKEIQNLFGEDALIAGRFMHLRYDRWVGLHHDIFGADNVLVHDFADLTQDPNRIMAASMDFLGLPEWRAVAGLETRELKKNASRKVFRLNDDCRWAIRDAFRQHNEELREIAGVDLNRHF